MQPAGVESDFSTPAGESHLGTGCHGPVPIAVSGASEMWPGNVAPGASRPLGVGMRVLAVSGFLGAGKTTFIQELARRTGREFVIYENEYGQADIDAATLSGSDGLSVWESTENCICCTGKQDFASTVLTIANTLDPDYLVVEPTGVARLSSVLANVGMVSYERISVLEPVTVVDAGAWSHQRARFPEIYEDQVASAGTVVVSKVGGAMPGELAALRSWVEGLNPGARVVDEPWERLGDAWFCELLERGAAGAPAVAAAKVAGDGAPDADGFASLSLEGVALPSESHLLWLLDAVVAGVFGEVVRAKGHLRCGGQWLRFDVVDRMWSVCGWEPGESAQTGPRPGLGVFIGPDLRASWLREAFLPAASRRYRAVGPAAAASPAAPASALRLASAR